MQSAQLARPLAIGPLTVSNRIVMPPLVIWKADETGLVTDAHLEHYERSAGPGLMIVEATTIEPAGRLAATQLGIWDDRQIEGLARLASVIHSGGALAGIQIHHAGGSTNLKNTYGLAPRVPSLIERSPEGAVELSGEEIDALLIAFGAAARRALAAGFDVLELHGAHGYLITQFLSPDTNLRDDRWGGSAERRRAFLVEALGRVRSEIDAAGRRDSVALTVRLGVAASVPRTLSIDEGLAAARASVAAGADFLDVSNAGGINEDLESRLRSLAKAALSGNAPDRLGELTPTALLASAVRSDLQRVGTPVPVVSVDGYRDAELAEYALEAGVADLVASGRGILADPRWARKALGADPAPVERCQACRPRCFWFRDPPKCPARRRLAARGEQPAID